MVRCEICNREFKTFFVNKILCYKCDNCSLVKKVNLPSNIEEKERYDHHICDEGYMNYMKKLYESFKDYMLDGLTLDFGCGKLKALETIIGNNVISYDKYYVFSDYLNYEYDNIIMIEVLEHLSDFYNILIELKKILKSGGRFIISTNLHSNSFDNWWYFRDITHVTFFNKETFEELSKSLGLKIVAINGNLIILQA